MPQHCIVLVGVQGPRNIGSICRVMGNFGCRDLRLVAPEADHLCTEARHMAVKSAHILETANVFDRLEDAIADCHLSFGATRRFGKYRELFYSPAAAAGDNASWAAARQGGPRLRQRGQRAYHRRALALSTFSDH